MTHACCPDCRLRVIAASPGDAPPCPECGQPMVKAPAAESMGCRLVTAEPLAVAVEVALPVPPSHPS